MRSRATTISVSAEETAVGDHLAAGDRRHAADHDGEDFRPRHRGLVRFDEQRCFGLADENVARGGEAFSAREFHRLRHHPGERVDHALQDAEVVEHRRKRGEKDHRRQNRQGEDHAVCLHIEERTEDEFRAFAGKAEQLDEKSADRLDHPAHGRHVEDEGGEYELQQ